MTRVIFQEYEAFSEAIQEANMSMRLTSLEERRWSLQHVNAGSIRLQHGYEGGVSIAEGVHFASSAKPQLLHPPQHVTASFVTLARRFLTNDLRAFIVGFSARSPRKHCTVGGPNDNRIDLLQKHVEPQAEDRGVTVIGQSTQ
jgi:hypothetical protein